VRDVIYLKAIHLGKLLPKVKIRRKTRMDNDKRNKIMGASCALGVLFCGVGLIFTNAGGWMVMTKNFVLWFLTYYFGWKLAIAYTKDLNDN